MKPQVKYGLLTGVATFVVMIATIYTIQDRVGIMFYIYLFLLVFGPFYAVRETRLKKGFMSFGSAVGIATVTSVVSGLLSGLLFYFYLKFIYHTLIVKLRHFSMDMIESGKSFHLTSEQLAETKKGLNLNISPGSVSIEYAIIVIISGFFASLIIAAILRRENPDTSMPDF